ncbi:DNA ligase [Candidatus Woesearchaeota archaeon]|nr:DNA ligase [Candidatus Woesearchaeota archaeon]
MSIKEYQKKRDFRTSPEPKGSKKKQDNNFVIQQHDATNLHYDFRLNIDGVLVSWAVPKGPSTDPSVKRLAIRTEDHPLEYADFEGVIPEGYGAGTVMIWDRGTYRNLKDKSMSACLDDGHLTVWLKGKKLQGGYALTHTDKDRWLLVKMDDDKADARRKPTSTQNKSVKTGRTMKQIEDDS